MSITASDLEPRLLEGIEELKTGDPDRAIELFSEVALQARVAELPLMEASACGMLAQALLLTGRKEEGLPHGLRALEVAEEAGNEEAIANFRELVAALEEPDEPDEPVDGDGGDPEDLSEEEAILDGLNGRIQAAMDRALTGDPAGAVEELVDIAEESQNIGALGPEASAQIALGQLLLASGNADIAAMSLRRALAIAEELENASAADHIRELLRRAG